MAHLPLEQHRRRPIEPLAAPMERIDIRLRIELWGRVPGIPVEKLAPPLRPAPRDTIDVLQRRVTAAVENAGRPVIVLGAIAVEYKRQQFLLVYTEELRSA